MTSRDEVFKIIFNKEKIGGGLAGGESGQALL